MKCCVLVSLVFFSLFTFAQQPTFEWAKQMGGTSDDYGRSIAIDASGNVYSTGSFQGTTDFDPGAGVFNLTSAGVEDIYIQKLDANGNFIWAKQMGGSGGDFGLSIDIDGSGNVYSTGKFEGTVDFDPGAGVFNFTSAGSSDIYTQKLGQCTPITGTDVQTACDTYDWIDGNTYTATNNSAQWTLTNAAGCDSVVTLNLTINTVDATANQSGDINIEANTSGATYQWLDCNDNYSEINGETNQQFTATANGDYAVEVTMNGCADTSNCYTVTTIGIIENSFDSQLVVYPNPTIGNFTIDLGATYNSVSVTISDVKGKLIQSNTFKDSQLLDLNLSEPNGVYLLKIESESNKAIIRILKK